MRLTSHQDDPDHLGGSMHCPPQQKANDGPMGHHKADDWSDRPGRGHEADDGTERPTLRPMSAPGCAVLP